ncbi:MAG: orotidine-5'-phosphate decarboxylase [Gammaproteobacteria bacterium]|nr:orotidine-5'-phosphate decarboxylase [Gammaproteobacteria bacterium]MDE0415106.1 orotidine-5'-phosphate decarboxylase [Gammaproteobacteria bacterium]
MLTFPEKLARSFRGSNAQLCVGLDPDLHKIPNDLRSAKRPIFEFNKRIVDSAKSHCKIFKPQAAFYHAVGAENDLADTIRYIREEVPDSFVILDAKRGDVGHTSKMYALEAFDRYGADAVTVNPFLGLDCIEPFIERDDRGAIILCKTSNPGSGFLQDMHIDGNMLFEKVAAEAEELWQDKQNVMLVVGATFPREMSLTRKAAPSVPFLVPGIGSQNGSLASSIRNGRSSVSPNSLIISASRSIIYSGGGTPHGIEEATRRLSDEIAGYEVG